MTEEQTETRIEPRWTVAALLCLMMFILAILPGRVRMFPAIGLYALWAVALIPILAVAISSGHEFWLRIERISTLLFCVMMIWLVFLSLTGLVRSILSPSAHLSGFELLMSGIAVWVTNVVIFGVLFWRLDRGGPEARLSRKSPRPDWLFPQDNLQPQVQDGWAPKFIDYFFLAYSTATAFSATDALPLTARAKVLLIAQSAISLTTMVVIASRAINILGN